MATAFVFMFSYNFQYYMKLKPAYKTPLLSKTAHNTHTKKAMCDWTSTERVLHKSAFQNIPWLYSFPAVYYFSQVSHSLFYVENARLCYYNLMIGCCWVGKLSNKMFLCLLWLDIYQKCLFVLYFHVTYIHYMLFLCLKVAMNFWE